ncbi:hypothetical protein [Mesorhizobium sp.]|uniref:hypothetical protein n=1 Tax=Mesorhizobium sp. TaxID=1871066 RepID=UPI00341B5F08
MERIEAIDSQIGLPFAWFLLMTHRPLGRSECRSRDRRRPAHGPVRQPDQDAAILLAWAD